MNDLILERGSTPGMYIAQMTIEGEYMTGCGYSWLEAINDLLAKISWKYHGK